MGEYFTGVFAVLAVVLFCGFISYRRKRSSAARMALSILIIHTVLMPLGSIASGDLSFDIEAPDPDTFEGGDYAEVAREAFCEGISKLIAEEFSLDAKNISVYATGFEFSSMRAERISVLLSGRAAFADPSAIEKYINGLDVGRCECEIEI